MAEVVTYTEETAPLPLYLGDVSIDTAISGFAVSGFAISAFAGLTIYTGESANAPTYTPES